MRLLAYAADTLSFRDSRPFSSSGGTMRTQSWPLPSAMAGALRTALGKEADPAFPADLVEKLLSSSLRGPFPALGGQLFFPRPLDALALEERGSLCALRPMGPLEGEGADLPPGLELAGPVEEMGGFKPRPLPAWWGAEAAEKWLASARGGLRVEDLREGESSLAGFARDGRTRIALDPLTGKAREGFIFGVEGLDLTVRREEGSSFDSAALAVDFTPPPGLEREARALEETMIPLGGSRRFVRLSRGEGNLRGWEAPEPVVKALTGQIRFRLALVSPALFDRGWMPGWLSLRDGIWQGRLPETDLEVSLVSAVVGRWQPLGGWDYRAGHRGPKALRRMVPAGSVYFFESRRPLEAREIRALWLSSLCDQEQDRRDGFGAAVVGCWDRAR